MLKDEFEQDEVITLIDEDGEEQNFALIDIVQVDGAEYAILLPIEDEAEAEEAIILKFSTDEYGNEVMVDVDDDKEWEKVADAWEKMVINNGS